MFCYAKFVHNASFKIFSPWEVCVNLSQYFKIFLDDRPGQSSCSRRNYSSRLRGFLEYHGHKRPSAIKPADINAWLAELNGRSYREATLVGYRQAIKALFNYLVREGVLERSPARHVATGNMLNGDRRTKLPPEADVQAAAAVARAWLHSDNLGQLRAGLLFLLSLESGPRLGELRNLRLADVEASLRRGSDRHGIYTVQSFGKTKHVVIRFGEETAGGLRRWLIVRPRTTADYCFITTRPWASSADPRLRLRQLTKDAATGDYKKVSAAAGLPKPILSHALRHRLGDKITRQFSPKVAAKTLNHKDAHTAAVAHRLLPPH